jgi:hypothetical protein
MNQREVEEDRRNREGLLRSFSGVRVNGSRDKTQTGGWMRARTGEKRRSRLENR